MQPIVLVLARYHSNFDSGAVIPDLSLQVGSLCFSEQKMSISTQWLKLLELLKEVIIRFFMSESALPRDQWNLQPVL